MPTATATRPRPESRAVAVRSESEVLKALDAEMVRRQTVIEDSAASLIDPRRLKAVVLGVFTRRPELWECDPVSVARAVVECAQVGLEPTGAIGGAHLVPFFNSKTGKKEVQLILDYRGGVALARRSGEVKRVEARIVREADEFDFEYGLEPTLRHVPALVEDPGPMKFVYAVAIFADGSRQFDVMSAVQVESVRLRSKSKDNGPWVSDPFEMAKKTVLKRLLKLLPLSIEARQILEIEDEQDRAPEVRVHGPAAQMRSTLRDRVARTFTAAEPDVAAVSAGVADDATDAERAAGREALDRVEAEATEVCPEEACVLAPGHTVLHKNTEGETW